MVIGANLVSRLAFTRQGPHVMRDVCGKAVVRSQAYN